MNTPTISLKDQWNSLREENPKIRSRQAAKHLSVGEAELLASTCDGKKVVRLDGPWDELIRHVGKLGYVMTLTRNEAAVHETKGHYKNADFNNHAGLVLGDNIDLRLFLQQWEFGFAAPVENPRRTLYSLQFFDQSGTAVHKVYLMNEDHHDDYQNIINDFRHPSQKSTIKVKALPKEETEPSDKDVRENNFLNDWEKLENTHQFYSLLNDYNIKRTQAMRLAEGSFTRRVSNDSVARMLRLAAGRDIPIMVFVRNRGVIQIYSGPVSHIKVMDQWVNILDAEFNLHLRHKDIDQSWVVLKPTNDGPVTSLELYDWNGSQIVTFFGVRKPGNPEAEAWKKIMSDLI